MAKTKHFESRIQQRGILKSTIEMAQRYGFPQGDKMILGKKQIRKVLVYHFNRFNKRNRFEVSRQKGRNILEMLLDFFYYG